MGHVQLTYLLDSLFIFKDNRARDFFDAQQFRLKRIVHHRHIRRAVWSSVCMCVSFLRPNIVFVRVCRHTVTQCRGHIAICEWVCARQHCCCRVSQRQCCVSLLGQCRANGGDILLMGDRTDDVPELPDLSHPFSPSLISARYAQPKLSSPPTESPLEITSDRHDLIETTQRI